MDDQATTLNLPFGLTFADLYHRNGLVKLDQAFLNFLQIQNQELSFQYISHRVLRWSVTPVCLLLLFPLNIILTLWRAGWLYDIILLMQLFFYFSGLLGWFFANRNIKIKALYVPYYFLFMNLSVIWGFIRFVKRGQSVLWEKAAREKTV